MGLLTNIPSENVRVDVTVSLNTLYKKKESMRATILCSAKEILDEKERTTDEERSR